MKKDKLYNVSGFFPKDTLVYNAGMNKQGAIFIIVILVIVALGLYYKQTLKPANIPSENPKLGSTEKASSVNTNKKNVLDLSNQGMDKLPAYVLKMSELEELNISNNRLDEALPAEIHDLRKLRILDASNNLMTGVPAEVGQLQNLEILNLSNNKLTGLPYELGNLKKLKVLNLSGNNYSKQDLEVIKKGLPPKVEIIL